MNSILEKEPVKRAEKVLKNFDDKLDVLVLKKTARTATDAAAALGCSVGAIVKSLVFKVEEDFILCLVSGDKRCSLNKLKKILNKQNVFMANPDDVKKITGYTIGGVSPVGHLSKLRIILDKNLKRFSKIYAAAGHPNAVFEIGFDNLIKLTTEEIKEFTE